MDDLHGRASSELARCKLIRGDPVEISSFTGPMVSEEICVPMRRMSDQQPYWQGRVRSGIGNLSASYVVHIEIDGEALCLEPLLNVVDPAGPLGS